MRILHTESSRNFGGQELRAVEEMEWFQKHGHRVWLAAAADSGVTHAAQERGLTCLPVRFCGSINPRAIIQVVRHCLREKVDLIVSRSSRDSFCAAIVARLTGTPMLRYQHICTRLKDSAFHRLVWHSSRKVVAVSESIRQRLLEQKLVPAEKISLLGEYVDTSIFHPRVSAAGVREKHGISPDATLVTQIGMIRPDKGQRVLVLAVDEILRRHPQSWFLFVGCATEQRFHDQLRDAVRGIAHPERIVFAGFQRELPPYLAASDIVCLTSLIEAQSKIIPQAFAMRKLVIASNVGGIPELVRHGQNGLLYDKGDPAALVEAVHTARSMDTTALREAALADAQLLDMEHLMQRTLTLYAQILA